MGLDREQATARAIVAAAICAAVLGGCGSAKTSHSAAINAALRRLQAEFEHARPTPAPRGKTGLGSITLFHASPPKGVSAGEWQTAMHKDPALQRAIIASK
jgi:hypothetical protein